MMTKDQYESAKKELKDKEWRLKNLTGSDSYTQHMKMHIDLLKSVIAKYEDCYHINKPALQHIEISTEVLP